MTFLIPILHLGSRASAKSGSPAWRPRSPMPSTTAPASGYGTFQLHSTRSCLHDGLKTTERESFNAHSSAMRSGLCRLLGFSNDNNRRGRESINPFYFAPVHDLGLALSRRPVPSCGDEFNQARTPFFSVYGVGYFTSPSSSRGHGSCSPAGARFFRFEFQVWPAGLDSSGPDLA